MFYNLMAVIQHHCMIVFWIVKKIIHSYLTFKSEYAFGLY